MKSLHFLENHPKAHLKFKIKFSEGQVHSLKREYIKSLNGRSNVKLMVAKYGV